MGHLQGSVLPVGTSHHRPSASGLEGQTFPNLAKQCHPKLLQVDGSQDTFSGFLHAPPAAATRQQVLFGDETS